MSTDAAPVANGAAATIPATAPDAGAVGPSTSTNVNVNVNDAANGSAAAAAPTPKRTGPKVNPSGKGKRKRNRRPLPDPYSPADVLWHDVVDFLGPEYVEQVLARGDDSEWDAPKGLERFSEVQLNVGAMTVSGE